MKKIQISQAFADALLVIPKALASNSGFDPQEATVKLQSEYFKVNQPVGIDLSTGMTNIAREYFKKNRGQRSLNTKKNRGQQ